MPDLHVIVMKDRTLPLLHAAVDAFVQAEERPKAAVPRVANDDAWSNKTGNMSAAPRLPHSDNQAEG